jgi:hydroxymethylpyrimidine pyrophosphatase-like HAD family hydrolase
LKFLVLALDYDGTIARDGVLDPDVRQAIAGLRARGIIVILVTGRILEDLRRVCGELHFVDAVVAENGAFIAFPGSGYTNALAPAPPPNLLAELRAQNVIHAAGRSVVEADSVDAPRILAILRRLELPLALVFNRGRVMVLPQAVSKATGLRRALAILRLSAHNAIGIGDAENDHELLRECELGVAVEWGSVALKAMADSILPGKGPSSVTPYLRSLGDNLPAPSRPKRHLLLGHTDAGEPLALAVRGRNVLVAGDPKSGKSWVAGLLAEQLILYGYSLCILDPEGDYVSLEALPGVLVFGGADPLPKPRDLVRALRHSDVSIVIDLSHAAHQEKLDYLHTVLPALAVLRRRTGLPHRIVLDEAHYFLQDPESRHLLDLDLSGYTLVTYRASALCEEVLQASQAIIVTRESDPQEIECLMRLCSICTAQDKNAEEWTNLLGKLVIGEALALPVTEEAHGTIQRIHLQPRLTPHVRHLAKYIDVPIAESRAFVFSHDGVPGPRARTLREFTDILGAQPLSHLDGHLRRKDFSRWIFGVFGDYRLGKTIRGIEETYAMGKVSEVIDNLVREIRSRYDVRLDAGN